MSSSSSSAFVVGEIVSDSHRETVFKHNFVSGTRTLNTHGIQRATLTGNTTFAMPGPASSHTGRSFNLILRTGVGGFTATFTGVKWPQNTAPVLTRAGNKIDVFCFFSDGDLWYGSVIQKYL